MSELPPTSDLPFSTNITRWSSPAGRARAGGDWCDVHPLSDDLTVLTVGDVSGHGPGASATMEFMRTSIEKALGEHRIPTDILARANALACGMEGGPIVTAIVAILDCRLRTFTFANAGHPPPHMVSGVEHDFLSSPVGDLPLGIFPNHRAAQYVVALPADVLITLYTDGITEHRRDLISGEHDLARVCRRVYDRCEAEHARVIAQRVFRKGRGSDDAAVLAVRIGTRQPPDRRRFQQSRKDRVYATSF